MSEDECVPNFIRVEIKSKQPHNQDEIVRELFSGITFNNKQIHFNGSIYTIFDRDRVKEKLMSLFGSTNTLRELDENIRELVHNFNGYLQSKSSDVIELDSSEMTIELQNIIEIVMASLSHEVVLTVKKLLENLNKLLLSKSVSLDSEKVDTNIVIEKSGQVIILYIRYDSILRENKWSFFNIFKRKKKRIRIRLATRRIGISNEYIEKISKLTTPEFQTRSLSNPKNEP